jgi:hypothetical protein
MYCTHCGSEIEPGAKFCTNCGAPVEEQQASHQEAQESSYQEEPYQEQHYQENPEPEKKNDILENVGQFFTEGNWSETYLWLLAVLPILNVLHVGSGLIFILGIVFVVLDYRELQKRNGVKLALWVPVIGALFNFIYLIARPNGTSKNYKPLILFFILAVVSAFIRGY